MSAISVLDKPRFERWVIANYPQIFENYELSEVVEYMDLDEWLERCTEYTIINEWRKLQVSRSGG